MSHPKCDACGTAIGPADGVWLGSGDERRFLCSKCCNETLADYLGIDYEHGVQLQAGDLRPQRRAVAQRLGTPPLGPLTELERLRHRTCALTRPADTVGFLHTSYL